MRIIYGCNSQAQGHLSKAATLVPSLIARGHDVHVVTSGPPLPPSYSFPRHRHVAGLEYAIQDGRASIRRTAADWLRTTPRICESLRVVRRLVRDVQPELIISDFEPLTASPLLQAPCEVVSVCRQAALLDPAIETPAPASAQARLVRTMFRLFMMGADRRHGYHYQPTSHRCLPPIIRPELFLVEPQAGDHLLIYNVHLAGRAESERLIRWASDRRIPVRAYGFDTMPRGRVGYVRFQPASRRNMLLDMASARAVLTTAGLTTAAEAFLLRKPACVVPLPDQWEQLANAVHLEQAGMALPLNHWDYDQALELAPPPAGHPLNRWLMTGSDQVLDAILGESRGAAQRAAA